MSKTTVCRCQLDSMDTCSLWTFQVIKFNCKCCVIMCVSLLFCCFLWLIVAMSQPQPTVRGQVFPRHISWWDSAFLGDFRIGSIEKIWEFRPWPEWRMHFIHICSWCTLFHLSLSPCCRGKNSKRWTGICSHHCQLISTPWKINMEPKNGGLEDAFPFQWANGWFLGFPGCIGSYL